MHDGQLIEMRRDQVVIRVTPAMPGLAGRDATALLDIDPPVAGEAHWNDRGLIVFKPHEPWIARRNYQFSIGPDMGEGLPPLDQAVRWLVQAPLYDLYYRGGAVGPHTQLALWTSPNIDGAGLANRVTVEVFEPGARGLVVLATRPQSCLAR